MIICDDCRRFSASEVRTGASRSFTFCGRCARRWDRITAEIDARLAKLHAWSDGQVREEKPYRCGAFVTANGEQCALLSDHDGFHVFAAPPNSSSHPPTQPTQENGT